DGITKLPEMLAAGVRVALGTDGGCSNNRTSVFDEMRMCALLQKVARLDGSAIDAETVFHLGTAGGGDVLGLPIGRIAPGCKADLVALDLDDISLCPPHNLLKNIVYSMSPTAIRRVMVGGRLVWAGGELLTFPLARIRRLVETVTAGWRDRVAADGEGAGSGGQRERGGQNGRPASDAAHLRTGAPWHNPGRRWPSPTGSLSRIKWWRPSAAPTAVPPGPWRPFSRRRASR